MNFLKYREPRYFAVSVAMAEDVSEWGIKIVVRELWKVCCKNLQRLPTITYL
jgi:hypothetical protein